MVILRGAPQKRSFRGVPPSMGDSRVCSTWRVSCMCCSKTLECTRLRKRLYSRARANACIHAFAPTLVCTRLRKRLYPWVGRAINPRLALRELLQAGALLANACIHAFAPTLVYLPPWGNGPPGGVWDAFSRGCRNFVFLISSHLVYDRQRT